KLHEEIARGTLGELSRRFREEARGEIVVVIGPAAEPGTADIGFATDALRGLIRAGARPRAAASVVSALTGVPANDLYRGITGRDPRR
ncbi:MAG TPA: 16S rRNA (cytidine(1402)-2'-O)-methyltransferase, partial [Solirubrobacterales bacterium]|nr:16S rRNA (cytidine(1402)-2'-O)-methyltransferase [Solirubrobacterales bacterium]